ncbi:MAG: GNAT family N-acetyltransferase [Clostridia bacterium]|nr:GNAT family N-acetyltransferase [Clostridia bacterium]
MILRHFDIKDIKDLKKYRYPEKSDLEILSMINEWNQCGCSGRYFEMFTVAHGGVPVGEVSVYEHNTETVSIGIHIFEPFRRKGFAYFGVNAALKQAKKKNYDFAISLIDLHNEPAIKLFKKLEFDPIGEFINPRGARVLTYKKFIEN